LRRSDLVSSAKYIELNARQRTQQQDKLDAALKNK
jgi:hypothetical protein